MLGDIEDVKHQIALLLDSQAAGANGSTFLQNLTAIDTEKADGVVTPAPAEINENERVTPTNFPSVQLIGQESGFDQESNPTLQDGLHQVVVVWLAVGDDEAAVTKYIERLVRATRMTLWGSTFAGAINAGPVQVLREDYSELVQPENAFLKGGRTFVAVPTLVQ